MAMNGFAPTHARSFAFETTLSGRGCIGRIRNWRAAGYHVTLVFLSLSTPEEAVEMDPDPEMFDRLHPLAADRRAVGSER